MAVYDRKDRYYKKAKEEGYRSRASYKLIEIDNKYKLIKKGYNILDCGSAPGGWSQVVLERLEGNGKLVAVDIEDMENFSNQKNFLAIKGDFTNIEIIEKIKSYSAVYDLVISDIAPHTSGVKDTDHYNSYLLVQEVFKTVQEVLKNGGSFLFKMFEGSYREAICKEIKPHFNNIKIIKPDATRKGSVEIYILGNGHKRLI